MTCDTMLEQMLEADLEALSGRGSSPVAIHVRECGRCRAVAEQLVADTRLLASAVETPGGELPGGREAVCEARIGARRRTSRGRYLIVGSLAAAALALVVVRPGADDGVRPIAPPIVPPASTASHSASRRGAGDAVAPSVPVHGDGRPATPPRAAAVSRVAAASSARVAAGDRAASRGASPRIQEPSSPSLVRSALRQFPRARPVTATRFAVPSAGRGVARAEPPAVVAVTPPPGMRVAVMRTRDPRLTVVWLY